MIWVENQAIWNYFCKNRINKLFWYTTTLLLFEILPRVSHHFIIPKLPCLNCGWNHQFFPNWCILDIWKGTHLPNDKSDKVKFQMIKCDKVKFITDWSILFQLYILMINTPWCWWIILFKYWWIELSSRIFATQFMRHTGLYFYLVLGAS